MTTVKQITHERKDMLRKTTAIDPGWRRIETLYDLFQADTARTEAGLPDNWINTACRYIRSLPWYISTPVAELEQRLKSLPWWYSLLQKDKLKKLVSEEQRAARVMNMQKARQAKAEYAAPYVVPLIPHGALDDEARKQEADLELTAV